MLFDLRSGKRRRVVQVVFGSLAALFALSFVFFGVGGEVTIDPSEWFKDDGPDATQYDSQISEAEDKLAKDPKNEQALIDLARYRYLAGQTQVELAEDGTTGTVTDESRQQWSQALDAWDRYLKGDPKQPDPVVAGQMLCAYDPTVCGLAGADPGDIDVAGAAEAMEILAADEPSPDFFGQLAYYRYAEGDIPAGDEAADKAVSEATGAQRKDLEKQLTELGDQARKIEKQQKKAGEQSPGAPGEAGPTSLSNPFGGLGSGAAPPGGAVPAP